MGENHFAAIQVAFYGIVSLMSSIAYYFLAHCLIAVNGKKSTLAIAVGNDKKGLISIILYTLAIGSCFISAWIGLFIYVVVACIWFIPDKRIEDKLSATHTE